VYLIALVLAEISFRDGSATQTQQSGFDVLPAPHGRDQQQVSPAQGYASLPSLLHLLTITKHESVVLCRPTELQLSIYNKLITSRAVKALFSSGRGKGFTLVCVLT
jgi:hypothetical protein